MTNLWGTGIFWTTIDSVMAILSLSTFIGRAWACLLPYKFNATARFYLAPALGLSSLTIIATFIGRYWPLGNTVATPLLVGVLLVFLIASEKHAKQALYHAFTVSVFGIFCGVSVLAPLYAYGAFNAHNDAFTYLVHSDWLQTHAFKEAIPAANVTPFETQVLIYQQQGLRMGASFLLALVQALLNIRWAYQIYPAVIIAGIATCCLSLGFPLARTLRRLRRYVRLMMLVMPAFSFGGLIFAANFGFLPQTIGLTLGAAFLFLTGPLFRWVATTKPSINLHAKASLNIITLFVGSALAYSEFVPFLLLATFVSACILAFRFRSWSDLAVHCMISLVISSILLNVELVRAYNAIKMQSSAIVGTPIDWTLLGFVSHALGVHGGAWDEFQWTHAGTRDPISYTLGILILALIIVVLVVGLYAARKNKAKIELLPSVIVILILWAGVIYYRYFTISPFSVGTGQSWSQFKLADWAHPFVMLFFLFALASLRNLSKKLFFCALLILLVPSAIEVGAIGVKRTLPLMNYYKTVSNLDQFYLQLRDEVSAKCPENMPIYLALGGEDLKFRQMAVLYLYDRNTVSDWTDDIYIYPALPEARRIQMLEVGSCVVEYGNGKTGWLTHGAEIGIARVGRFDGRGRVRVLSVSGAYDRESDGKNWWHWVGREVSFKLQPIFISENETQTKLHFEYATRSVQTLTLQLAKNDGTTLEVSLPSASDSMSVFDSVIDIHPNNLVALNIKTDGAATPLGHGDSRVAAWIIRNVTVTPASP